MYLSKLTPSAWRYKSEWYHHSKTPWQETLALPAGSQLWGQWPYCKMYLSELQNIFVQLCLSMTIKKWIILRQGRPWHCQLGLKCGDNCHIAKYICQNLPQHDDKKVNDITILTEETLALPAEFQLWGQWRLKCLHSWLSPLSSFIPSTTLLTCNLVFQLRCNLVF